jgi:peptide/nickel transport system substrate-binding protein
VASISATSQDQVAVTLKQPDYWRENELSSAAGIITEKSFAEKQGKNYGTPAGSIMCTGAYMLKSWTPGAGVVAVRNPHYWNPSVHPLIGQITIKGVPNIASLTAGLLTNAVQGVYATNDSTLNQLSAAATSRSTWAPAGPPMPSSWPASRVCWATLRCAARSRWR